VRPSRVQKDESWIVLNPLSYLQWRGYRSCQTCWCWWQLLWDLNIICVVF